METTVTTRPRNVDWKRAAAMLYGDWGTSKAYVTGIAFAVAGVYLGSSYSSFWLVAAVGLLILLIGINYIWICKYFPEGGGVYSSAKAHFRTLALIGGFLLVADYLVTASLSCFDAFVYFNMSYEEAKRWSILTIFIIGCINFFGPRHSGTLALILAVATMFVVAILGVACIPQLPDAVANLQRPQGSPLSLWVAFAGVILALSGVEAIANMTGVMKLDPGSSPSQPRVARTARKAIIVVMIEVCVLTVLFGLAMHAIPDMGAKEHEGDMLRHMGQVFVDEPLADVLVPASNWLRDSGETLNSRHVPVLGHLSLWLSSVTPHAFSWTVSLVIGLLLLSATNTAIIALVSILYLMAKDGEMPKQFTMLNQFGVPWILLLFAILGPILIIDVQPKEEALHGMAAMYAIGVVGAIAVNLGSCAFNFRLPMRSYERIVMGASFVLMVGIEITIAITKPAALVFGLVVLAIGFMARAAHKGSELKIPAPVLKVARRFFPALAKGVPTQLEAIAAKAALARDLGPARPITTIMVCAKGVTPTLRYAVDQAHLHNAELVVVFIRELYTHIPVAMRREDDPEAQAVFEAATALAEGLSVVPVYDVSDDPAFTICDKASIAGADMLILGHSRRSAFTRLLRGNVLEQIGSLLPEEIRLVVVG